MNKLSQPRLPLFQVGADLPTTKDQTIRQAYTNDGVTSCQARIALELEYASLLSTTDEFNRKLVSYQANKKATLHSWLKYKEGFSAQLVEMFLDKFNIRSGQKLLDPFAGSATALLVAGMIGIDAVGIELLAVGHWAWKVKSQYREYDTAELRQVLHWLQKTEPGHGGRPFPHIVITDSAFPTDRESQLMWYGEQFASLAVSDLSKRLLRFVLMSILEEISYTRKDGQYLRWDSRSPKAQNRDTRRASQEKPPFKPFSKGEIHEVKPSLIAALSEIIHDVEIMQQDNVPPSHQVLLEGTVLEILPHMDGGQFDAVITSPPYCNRYDYTRTYALELAYFGAGEEEVRKLRQELLTCTVENRSKLQRLNDFYSSIGRKQEFEKVIQTVNSNAALQEVFGAIRTRGERGELNNKGVIQMVEGYFTELAFVIFELYRVCRPGAHVAIVNDNVRYGGEVIPVDLLMTDLAVGFGFSPERIYVLPQRKGNSSQQMGKYGREANRKSITVWIKTLVMLGSPMLQVRQRLFMS